MTINCEIFFIGGTNRIKNHQLSRKFKKAKINQQINIESEIYCILIYNTTQTTEYNIIIEGK